MERNSPQVDDVEQRFLRIANEVVELPLGVLAPDGFRADPIRRESGCVLLEERLPVDAVREPGHHDRPILEVRQQPRADGAVVVDQVAFGVTLVRPENLVQVGETNLVGKWERGRGKGLSRGRVGLRRVDRSNPTLPSFPFPLPLSYTLLRLLVIPKPEKHRLSQQPIFGPLLESHLADHLGLDPRGLYVLGDRSGARRALPLELLQ